MNDLLLPQELAAILAGPGYSTVAAAFPVDEEHPIRIAAPQAAVADATPPFMTILGEWTVYGSRRLGTLTLEIRTRGGDEGADTAHQARVQTVIEAFLGRQGRDQAENDTNRYAAKLHLQDALSIRGQVTLAQIGPASPFIEADVDAEDLRTALMFKVAWAFTPPL